jgi:uncharacterized protein (DUF1330 family)
MGARTWRRSRGSRDSPHQATFLARFGGCEVKEGAAVEGVAIIQFPTFEEAKRWYESPTYQEASQHHFRGGDYNIVIVEGLPPPSAH